MKLCSGKLLRHAERLPKFKLGQLQNLDEQVSALAHVDDLDVKLGHFLGIFHGRLLFLLWLGRLAEKAEVAACSRRLFVEVFLSRLLLVIKQAVPIDITP